LRTQRHSYSLTHSHTHARHLRTQIKKYGIQYGVKLSQRLAELGTPGLHYYCLNQSATTLAIVEGLGYTLDELVK